MPSATTQSTRDILVAGGGAVWVAPVGTTAPPDSVQPYGTGWQNLGLSDDAGVKLTDSKTVVEITSWENFYDSRRVISKRAFTAATALQQWNWVTLPLAFGGGTLSTPVAGSTATISNKAVTSNVVTLTTSAAHGFSVGQYVVITGMADATLNGSFVITAVGSSTTFSYALTHGDVASTSATGTATVGAVYKYTPPVAGAIDERALGIDWIDGTRNYRLIIPKGIVSDNVEASLVKNKEALLPITFGATTVDGGTPYSILNNDGTAFS